MEHRIFVYLFVVYIFVPGFFYCSAGVRKVMVLFTTTARPVAGSCISSLCLYPLFSPPFLWSSLLFLLVVVLSATDLLTGNDARDDLFFKGALVSPCRSRE